MIQILKQKNNYFETQRILVKDENTAYDIKFIFDSPQTREEALMLLQSGELSLNDLGKIATEKQIYRLTEDQIDWIENIHPVHYYRRGVAACNGWHVTPVDFWSNGYEKVKESAIDFLLLLLSK